MEESKDEHSQTLLFDINSGLNFHLLPEMPKSIIIKKISCIDVHFTKTI